MKALFTTFLIALGTATMAQDDFTKDFKRINDNVLEKSAAYKNLKHASETIGHRLTGSENGAKAEQYTYDLMKSYGLKVEFQPFQVESWSRKTIDVKIGSDLNSLASMKAVTLAHSPVESNIKGEIVDMGNGLESDYINKPNAVKGKIALIYLGVLPGSPQGTGSLHRSEKTEIAIKNGAIGVIIINTVKDGVLLTGTASVTGKVISIPAVCIGLEDGMSLKEKLKSSPQYASIQMTNFSGEIKARNVIATIKGTKYPNEKIVIGGHLDSWDLATGAIDNGIGSFAIVDMARAFKELGIKPLRTVEFVMFMGEEQGLLGSKAYVAEATKKNKLDQIKFMLNFDMTNDPKGFSTTRKEMESSFKSWGSQVQSFEPTFPNQFNSGAGLHSDHQPFMLLGIPTGGGAGGSLPNNARLYYHSDGDAFNLVDEKGLKNTVRYGAILAYGLSNIDKIPVTRMEDAQLKQFLIDNKLEVPLTISGDWRW